MVRRIAVRKILHATGSLRLISMVVVVSTVLAAVGFILYMIVPSDVVLMEAFVWLIEAMSFGGLLVAFRAAASRTVFYRARYEILRLESLAALITAVFAMATTVFVIVRSLLTREHEVTPCMFSLYLIASGIVSLVLEHYCVTRMRFFKLRLVAVRVVIEKLKLDVLLELAGGFSIILSNLINSCIPEKSISIVMGAYVIYGLFGIALESAIHLIGVVTRRTYRRIYRVVREELNKVARKTRVRRMLVKSYGTFYEIEIWLEAPPSTTLNTAYKESMKIAHRLVHNIPELLRALVIFIPEKTMKRKEKRYSRRRSVRTRVTLGEAKLISKEDTEKQNKALTEQSLSSDAETETTT